MQRRQVLLCARRNDAVELGDAGMGAAGKVPIGTMHTAKVLDCVALTVVPLASRSPAIHGLRLR